MRVSPWWWCLGALGALSCTARQSVQQCTYARDCLAPLACVAGQCRSQCADDRDCVGGSRCALVAGANANVCISTAAVCGSLCGMGTTCRDNACVSLCSDGTPCPAGSACAPSSGLCVAPPTPDAGPDAAAEASAEASVEAGPEASVDAGLDVVEAGPEAGADARPEASADAGGDGGATCGSILYASSRCTLPGESLCGGRCVSLNESSAHCNTCGAACTGGQLCISGACATWSAARLVASSYMFLLARRPMVLPLLGWGEAAFGALPGWLTSLDDPAALVGTEGAAGAATGYRNGCIVAQSDGSVRCWGWGMADLDTATNSGAQLTPTLVPGLTGVLEVSVGRNFACALQRDRSVSCWGRVGMGLLGDVETTASFTAMPRIVALPSGAAPVQHLTSGTAHSCALGADGLVYCWGYDGQGVVGRSVIGARAAPGATLPLDSAAIALEARGDTTCALTQRGTVFCWGDNSNGMVRPEARGGVNQVAPRPVAGLPATGLRSLGHSDSLFFALDGCGNVWGWGSNTGGVLSGIVPALAADAAVVPTLLTQSQGPLYTGVTSVAGRLRDLCFLRQEGTLECIGTLPRGAGTSTRPVSSPTFN